MTVVPFQPRHGLTPVELASLVVFANSINISVETGVTEDGGGYAALDLGSCFDMASGEVVWVISRERSRIVAYGEEDGVLLSFRTVEDALTALRRLLPVKDFQAG
jgi:hypothetical protein